MSVAARARRLAKRGGKRWAEPLMLDRCRIRPVIGQITDPNTGEVTPEYGAAVYGPGVLPSEGRCKIQQQRLRYPETPSGGEHQSTVGVTEIHLPDASDAGAVATDHVVEITDATKAWNVGRLFRVQSPDPKTLQTAIRLICEEVLG